MLVDGHNRRMDYLRVSITDKCNLRCVYCMPPQGVQLLPHDQVLRNEEFVHFIGLFAAMGVNKVRFTGGEPLVRKGFLDIVRNTRSLHSGLELCLTTNGILLDEVLDALCEARLRKINISLDTMSRERYRDITGHDAFERVLANIEKALGYDCFDIKINTVLFEDSLKDLDAMLEYFRDKDVTLRFIERMPFGDSSVRHAFIDSGRLIEILSARGSLERNRNIDTSVAMMFTFGYRNTYSMRLGVIPSISHKFCSKCNRLRLTCDGALKTCLHSTQETDLKSPFRAGAGDDAISRIILNAINEKPREHGLDCASDGGDGCSSLCTNRDMSQIGG